MKSQPWQPTTEHIFPSQKWARDVEHNLEVAMATIDELKAEVQALQDGAAVKSLATAPPAKSKRAASANS